MFPSIALAFALSPQRETKPSSNSQDFVSGMKQLIEEIHDEQTLMHEISARYRAIDLEAPLEVRVREVEEIQQMQARFDAMRKKHNQRWNTFQQKYLPDYRPPRNQG